MSTLPLQFSASHPAFPGHFPGRPIVPGALLLDAVVRAAEAASGRAVRAIAQAKFTAPAGPDEALLLNLVADASGGLRFEVLRETTRVASGRLELA